ncbi:glutathione S-transferase N-terminal domain-containing protein [Azorhizobium doebereinerae]|uniref:glutathione S-transferase N-terminal domain-containing protein n=1 Tax=Azorhizobium doebereinerae TaxID=281091 RepID=UPI00040C171C|nr:glutathione S-transferase N-terminal domain-containing protein [Azorhizobium doebereinerae]
MRLRHSPASPFVRKCRLAAAVLGLTLDLDPCDTTDPTDSISQQNPLGKIPALLLDDGEVLFDSAVIVAYLDHLGGDKLIPAEPKARFAALKLEALADGIADAALLQIYEGRYRPEGMQVQSWLDRQAGKVARGLATLEASPPADGPVTNGDIALACALGYLDYRFKGEWRATHPRLVAWLEGFGQRVPAFAATVAP